MCLSVPLSSLPSVPPSRHPVGAGGRCRNWLAWLKSQPHSYELCAFRQVSLPLWALAALSVKWRGLPGQAEAWFWVLGGSNMGSVHEPLSMPTSLPSTPQCPMPLSCLRCHPLILCLLLSQGSAPLPWTLPPAPLPRQRRVLPQLTFISALILVPQV